MSENLKTLLMFICAYVLGIIVQGYFTQWKNENKKLTEEL